MSGTISIRRYVVYIDDVDGASDSPTQNPTNVSRLYASIRTGVFKDEQGRNVRQDAKYYNVTTSSSTLVDKLSGKSTTPSEQQIRDIVLDVCGNLNDTSDEVFFFGSGRGAYSVRAVTAILHRMGVPRAGHLKDFSDLYDATLNLIKAGEGIEGREAGTVQGHLSAPTHDPPNIQFVGLFDAIKSPADKEVYGTRIVSTVRHFRHALAFNENRTSYSPTIPETPVVEELSGRSFVQAWFLGYHSDIIGGIQHDGFSMYPLQWIMIEAVLAGLCLSFDIQGRQGVQQENPLALAFPQYAGLAPDLKRADNDLLWKLQYSNDIEILMFDQQNVHDSKELAQETSHLLHCESIHSLHTTPRRIFNKGKGGLAGYRSEDPSGTIIHPSVFCILDRNQRFLEQNRFKIHRDNLAAFETDCLRSDSTNMPPWLQDSELLASGVKAFRILVCGKTGVGKSTLINKVFGVELTEESNSYAQGEHDINKAFESPNHPGLLIHDSRGWQAGSDDELELIAQFLRHRAFQKDPADALHVIWFCVDSDVSRIEEADKRTFETIAQYSNTVPVFVVGTKKDKLIAFHKMALLEAYMQKTNDYQQSSLLANTEANRLADEQFATLRGQLAHIKSYKADGYVCISQNDDAGIRTLLTQTVEMIADDRVRLFCVAAQVVDVDKKIDSAITECMRLGTHAIRTAMVPLPFSGIVSTPTVSRIICEHVLLCFGFPKAVPDEVDEVMNRIVLGNLKKYLAMSLAQFVVMAAASSGLALATVGVGSLIWLASPFLSAAPTARMVLKCSVEMILILERSFRYSGKYVSVKQIEDAAKQYVSMESTISNGKTKKLQEHVRDQVDRLVPLKKVAVGFKFNKLRSGLEDIIYRNRFDKPPDYARYDPLGEAMAQCDAAITGLVEAPGDFEHRVELPGDTQIPTELDSVPKPQIAELAGTELPSARQVQAPGQIAELSSEAPDFGPSRTTSETLSLLLSSASTSKTKSESVKDESPSPGSKFLSRMSKSLKIKKSRTKE